jgi:hypothetical protein
MYLCIYIYGSIYVSMELPIVSMYLPHYVCANVVLY